MNVIKIKHAYEKIKVETNLSFLTNRIHEIKNCFAPLIKPSYLGDVHHGLKPNHSHNVNLFPFSSALS